MRWCRDDSKEKTSVDAAGAGGVGARAGGTETVVAGADEVSLVSVTDTAADRYPLGTLAKSISGRIALLLLHFILKLLNN